MGVFRRPQPHPDCQATPQEPTQGDGGRFTVWYPGCDWPEPLEGTEFTRKVKTAEEARRLTQEFIDKHKTKGVRPW